jgi:radical SAM-linked protein
LTRLRVRIRFRKEGDSRLISHRDLLRLFERAFRRAELALGMSEGFHPKARMSFPSALGLGVAGLDEVMEVELAEPVEPDELARRLAAQLPPGIAVNCVELLDEGAGKAQAARMTYEFCVPPDRRRQVQSALEALQAADRYEIERDDRRQRIDLKADLDALELCEDRLRFSLLASRTAGARPRDVLEALGLADLEQEGCCLVRTSVEVTT